jgi:SWI/SNF-related matrix-associated actin-dependent regulator of chromatin subfamily A3
MNELLQLSEPVTCLQRPNLASAEDDAYAHMGEIYRQEIDRAVSGCKTVEAYNGILQALLRFRLLCNHGTYEHHSREYGATSSSDPEEALTLLQ